MEYNSDSASQNTVFTTDNVKNLQQEEILIKWIHTDATPELIYARVSFLQTAWECKKFSHFLKKFEIEEYLKADAFKHCQFRLSTTFPGAIAVAWKTQMYGPITHKLAFIVPNGLKCDDVLYSSHEELIDSVKITMYTKGIGIREMSVSEIDYRQEFINFIHKNLYMFSLNTKHIEILKEWVFSDLQVRKEFLISAWRNERFGRFKDNTDLWCRTSGIIISIGNPGMLKVFVKHPWNKYDELEMAVTSDGIVWKQDELETCFPNLDVLIQKLREVFAQYWEMSEDDVIFRGR